MQAAVVATVTPLLSDHWILPKCQIFAKHLVLVTTLDGVVQLSLQSLITLAMVTQTLMTPVSFPPDGS